MGLIGKTPPFNRNSVNSMAAKRRVVFSSKTDTHLREYFRTAEMRQAFDKLHKVLPIHPKDSKSKKLNRIQILKRAIKYIQCLRMVIYECKK